jgi:hypothetical protein
VHHLFIQNNKILKMKSFKLFICASLFTLLAQAGFAQTKTQKIKVAGECGMCKNKIESSAKKAGASYAIWNVDTKELIVKYNSTSSSSAKIEEGIAKAGYDTPNYKAKDEAYDSLHECCKYDRSNSSAKCCDSEKCSEGACMKDGKCSPDMSCCNDSGCSEKDCCKKS